MRFSKINFFKRKKAVKAPQKEQQKEHKMPEIRFDNREYLEEIPMQLRTKELLVKFCKGENVEEKHINETKSSLTEEDKKKLNELIEKLEKRKRNGTEILLEFFLPEGNTLKKFSVQPSKLIDFLKQFL